MTRRILLLALLLLALSPGIAAAKRDPLAPVLDMPQAPVATVPDGLFLPEQVQGITSYVNEARQFGVPLAVRAITLPTSPAILEALLPLNPAAPTGQAIVQRMADEWLASEPLETSPGAADGILLFVVIPEDDHTQAMAAFATGRHAIPLNGLSQQSLDDVLDNVIRPSFQDNAIAAGIQNGVAMLSYDNLFAQPARLERTHQQKTLFNVTNTVLFGSTIVASLGLIGLAFWIKQRQDRMTGDIAIDSPFEAGALRLGRVDETVADAALLHLVKTGGLIRNETSFRISTAITPEDPFAQDVVSALASEAADDGTLPGAAIRRIQDVIAPARQSLENQLAERRLFNPVARVEAVWIVLASALVAIIALMALVPAIVSMSRLGLLGILIAALTIIGVLVWTAKRSWTTPAGQHALETWKSAPEGEGMAIFDTIVHQDDLLDTPGGPGVPPVTRLIRDFRALGAG
ncbi:MAG TPA: TIGR04222 domain-containing membrane protein [Thermomicrobiales bacterium]|nr:TIGR04222 domain-containing membrane protein [Thermomicrobiales bacterium]